MPSKKEVKELKDRYAEQVNELHRQITTESQKAAAAEGRFRTRRLIAEIVEGLVEEVERLNQPPKRVATSFFDYFTHRQPYSFLDFSVTGTDPAPKPPISAKEFNKARALACLKEFEEWLDKEV